MFKVLRLLIGLGLVVGMLGAQPALAQKAITKPWGRTDLDTLISVRTPYRVQDIQEPGAPWLTAFFTKGSYHHFVMMRLDVTAMLQQRLDAGSRKSHSMRADSTKLTAVTLDINKCLRLLTKSPLLAINKPRAGRDYVVGLPSTPGGQASRRVYTGADPDSHEPALMEVQWFELNGVVYFFFCTTVDPDGEDARQEKQKYFSTITLSGRRNYSGPCRQPLYVFCCSYSLPQKQGSTEVTKHSFSIIAFKPSQR
ncbi:hypothetical protein GCM10022409_25870 [Hymenobacter glaciei]|uniref:Uncharacterized protein n=1 Tax=Hymenobacter glaciei TaxID=877209 RepID=A0ABP7UAF8_9BACT